MLVSVERFRMLMDMTGVKNSRLASATGFSEAYVAQVRCGIRTRVARLFVSQAGDYLGRVLGEPGRVAVALIKGGPEERTGGKDAD